MKAGKVIAIVFFASWLAGIGAYIALRPSFKHGKELLKAVEADDRAAVRKLLAEGASVQVRDAEGHTALWHAAYSNRPGIAELLLTHGADPNIRGTDGMTPLMWATYNGNTEAVQVLLAHGANVNATDFAGRTALQLVSTDRQKPAADLLRKAGATVPAAHIR